MTEYFEVLERDAGARLASLRLDEAIQTPALIDPVRANGGSLWVQDRETPPGSSDQLTILPHRGMPTGTRQEVQEAFTPAVSAIDAPVGAVVTATTATDLGVDAYVLSGLTGNLGNARRIIEAMLQTREAIPEDTALYLPGIATPANVAVLSYAGADLFDSDAAVIAGTQGRYLTDTGEFDLEDLEELPCGCRHCREHTPESLSTDALIDHNSTALEQALASVRTHLRRGTLREYLEGQVRHTPWLTAALRLVATHQYTWQRTAVADQDQLVFTTDDALDRVEVRRFADRIRERYRSRFQEWPLVLLPCSAGKPYSESRSHRTFREAIDYRGHIVSLTSPLGVVPDELELTYPAQHYDTAVTGQWSASEREWVTNDLVAYLEQTAYPHIIAHVPDDGYKTVIDAALDRVDPVAVTYTASGHPTDEVSIENLRAALDGEQQYRRTQRYQAIVEAIADYQFGAGAGEMLFRECSISGRYPRLRAFDPTDTQLATLVQQTGQLALTLEGARAWQESGVASRTVEIDGFVPHGSVLAPGIVDADEAILVGDEVLIEGPKAFGVGRAEMFGAEMAESTRGVAVDVRHVEER